MKKKLPRFHSSCQRWNFFLRLSRISAPIWIMGLDKTNSETLFCLFRIRKKKINADCLTFFFPKANFCLDEKKSFLTIIDIQSASSSTVRILWIALNWKLGQKIFLRVSRHFSHFHASSCEAKRSENFIIVKFPSPLLKVETSCLTQRKICLMNFLSNYFFFRGQIPKFDKIICLLDLFIHRRFLRETLNFSSAFTLTTGLSSGMHAVNKQAKLKSRLRHAGHIFAISHLCG